MTTNADAESIDGWPSVSLESTGLWPNAKHAVERDGYGRVSIATSTIMLISDLDQ